MALDSAMRGTLIKFILFGFCNAGARRRVNKANDDERSPVSVQSPRVEVCRGNAKAVPARCKTMVQFREECSGFFGLHVT